ncbi:Ankyrin repeat-containing domain protein [Elaphomyces granulatus]
MTLEPLISGVAQADRAVEAFGSEVDLLSHTLASIQIGLKNPAFTTPSPDPAVDETVGCLQNDVHWQNVTEMVDNCEETLTRLRRIFEQVASGRSGLLLSRTARHIRLDMRSPELMELRRQVQMYQAMMQMSLQWIGIYLLLTSSRFDAAAMTSRIDLLQDTIFHIRTQLKIPDSTPDRHTLDNFDRLLHASRTLVQSRSNQTLGNNQGTAVLDAGSSGRSMQVWTNTSTTPGSPAGTFASTDPRRRSISTDNTTISEMLERLSLGSASVSGEDASIHRSQSSSAGVDRPPWAPLEWFISICNLVENACLDGRTKEAADLALDALRSQVTCPVSPSDWDDMRLNVLNSNGKGLASSWDGFTVLHLLAMEGLSRQMIVLLSRGSRIDAMDRNHCTPLHFSCQAGHVEATEVLINKRASMEVRAKDGSTPLHLACCAGNYQVVDLLIGIADIKAKDNSLKTPLHRACQKGHSAIVRLLIENRICLDACLEAKTEHGLTPLHMACKNGHHAPAALLIDANANIEATDKDGKTPLHFACRHAHFRVAKLLLDCKAYEEAKDRNHWTPLCFACMHGPVDLVKLLAMKVGVSIDPKTLHGTAPLHIACQYGQLDIVYLLLRLRQDMIHQKDSSKRTPLYVACKGNHPAVVKFLLTQDADIHAATVDSYTPLHIASEKGFDSVVKLLLDNQARFDQRAMHRWTPLYLACRGGKHNAARLLIRRGADIEAQVAGNKRPMHIACQEGHKSIVQLLLDHHANIDPTDDDMSTPLRIACEKGYHSIVSLLIKYDANIEARAKHDYTPLHSACWHGQYDIVQLLVEHGANVKALTIDGKTPEALAARRGYQYIVNFFRTHMERKRKPSSSSW